MYRAKRLVGLIGFIGFRGCRGFIGFRDLGFRSHLLGIRRGTLM